MKVPHSKEEFMAWPPMGAGVASIVAITLIDALIAFHQTIQTLGSDSVMAGYLFPLCMGIGIATRLKGKYWLGFAWLAFLFYLFALLIKFFSTDGRMGYLYMVMISCAIMFTSQSAFLYIKRRLQSDYLF